MQSGERVEVTIGAPIAVEGRDLASLMEEVSEFLKQHVER